MNVAQLARRLQGCLFLAGCKLGCFVDRLRRGWWPRIWMLVAIPFVLPYFIFMEFVTAARDTTAVQSNTQCPHCETPCVFVGWTPTCAKCHWTIWSDRRSNLEVGREVIARFKAKFSAAK